MSNLKFRAWFNGAKVYRHVSAINLEGEEITINENSCAAYYDFNEVILEQYTGLKDKEDKEIYIGDLFKIKYDYNWKKEDYFEVVFSRKLGIILRNSEGRWFHLVDKIKHYETVGNIHENKELLK